MSAGLEQSHEVAAFVEFFEDVGLKGDSFPFNFAGIVGLGHGLDHLKGLEKVFEMIAVFC